jgi:hypothetical protein
MKKFGHTRNNGFYNCRGNSVDRDNCNYRVSDKVACTDHCRSHNFSHNSWCRILDIWEDKSEIALLMLLL